ncbi:MAG: thiamine phosphate synthase [Gammaproteobacteria bacterium]|nr:MAG: thiamine phosphate synthase [Gammaproteobacteria bacterium]
MHGLYAIADRALLGGRLLPAAAAALQGGASLLQFRDKGEDRQEREELARALLALCRQHRVPLLINDDPGLAATIGADGVHLGSGDTGLPRARAMLGERALIGASCYNRLELALKAQEEGADYVAFGRFYPSRTKPEAVPCPVTLLGEARRHLSIPIVAIGGITTENGPRLLAAGADALAVIHGLFGQPDIEATTRTFHRIFCTTEARRSRSKSGSR